ncbi:MAG: DUF2958 domain-containing protein [Gemmatimonadota bacterium]|nr:MAG: DUF2958 domain-containing protein [Gemmatimonadota bacterium]
MKLMTKAIERKLPKLGATDGKGDAATVVVKFFTPDANATWFVTEGEQLPDGDWEFFGLADMGMGCPELGYFLLSQLRQVRGRFGLPIERDRYYTGTLADARKAVAA